MIRDEICQLQRSFNYDEFEAVNALLQIIAQEENIEGFIEDWEETLPKAA